MNYGSVWCVTNTSHRKLCRTQPDRHIPDRHYTPNSLCCQGLLPPQKSVQAGFGVSHKTDRLLLFKVSPPMRYSSAGWRGYGGKLLERSFPHPSRTFKTCMKCCSERYSVIFLLSFFRDSALLIPKIAQTPSRGPPRPALRQKGVCTTGEDVSIRGCHPSPACPALRSLSGRTVYLSIRISFSSNSSKGAGYCGKTENPCLSGHFPAVSRPAPVKKAVDRPWTICGMSCPCPKSG